MRALPMYTLLYLVLFLAGGCLEGKDADPGVDQGVYQDTNKPKPDVKMWRDKKVVTGDSGCALGTPNNCGKCGNKCPGPDDKATRRVCLAGGKCGINCKGDYYDVNGKVSDGCEILDTFAGFNSQGNAKHLANMDDCDSVAMSTVLSLPSDNRTHDKAPAKRELSAPKWFKVFVTDRLGCAMDFTITLDVYSLPMGANYEIKPLFVCKKGGTVQLAAKTGPGASVITATPSPACSSSDDSGTMYVKVSKKGGTSVHSNKPMKLSIKP